MEWPQFVSNMGGEQRKKHSAWPSVKSRKFRLAHESEFCRVHDILATIVYFDRFFDYIKIGK